MAITTNEPVKLTTKNGHEVTIRPFAPPRLTRKNRALFLAHASIDKNVLRGRKGKEDDNGMEFKEGIPASIVESMEDNLMRTMVLDINGKTGDDAFNFLMDEVYDQDYQQIKDKCQEIYDKTTVGDKQKKD